MSGFGENLPAAQATAGEGLEPRPDFSYEEMIGEFLASYGDNPEGYLTSAEIAERTGKTLKWVNQRLRLFHQMGKLECVRVQRESIIGTMIRVPGYRVKK